MMRPRGHSATKVVTIATAPEVPRGPALAAPERVGWQCWNCGASAGPLRCCPCGWTVAVSRGAR